MKKNRFLNIFKEQKFAGINLFYLGFREEGLLADKHIKVSGYPK